MENTDYTVISYGKLRHAIGILGLSLPFLIFGHCAVFGDCHKLQDSISHYYYSMGNVWFIGILWALGLVLIFYPAYKNEPKRDATLTTISGICAICVSVFPTNSNSSDSCALFTYADSNWRAGFHYFCAATMLLIFSYMSYRIFTQTHKGKTLVPGVDKWKITRNKVYRVCGVLTFLSVLTIAVLAVIELFNPGFPAYRKTTYWLEVGALVPFGFAWLVKGGFLFTDDDEVSTVGRFTKMFQKKAV